MQKIHIYQCSEIPIQQKVPQIYFHKKGQGEDTVISTLALLRVV